MVYIRKSGKGYRGTLRQQFNYYKRQMKDRLLHEQAFKQARGVSEDNISINMLFERLDFNDIYEHGITRKLGNETIRVTGIQAVEMQIESLRRRASKTEQANLYIVNYAQSLYQTDMPVEYISEIYQKMQTISIDKLTALLDSGQLKQIAFIYANKNNDEEYFEELKDEILAVLDGEVLDAEGNVIDFKTLKTREKFLYKQLKEKQKSGLF